MKKELKINSEIVTFDLLENISNYVCFRLGDVEYRYQLVGDSLKNLQTNENEKVSLYTNENEQCLVETVKAEAIIGPNIYTPNAQSPEDAAGSLKSPMPGKIFKVYVKEGDRVKKGDVLLVIEAMKMEHMIKAPKNGVVKKVYFNEAQQVSAQAQLVVIEDDQ